ncbi:RNase P subunit p30-domain-containing protein [Pseudoneurospora amorphoporcata]|uniref:RNase P subunit p30-domain-containing protein n=1 Tax=Pseudoneurospora amorphoporcata TaxID=241081 RepID=A0AAN6NRX4_9PEZI|nr:RNase P subunit p30-domain-containing protein [Pseudoneurospora amorphoporcata]
MLYDLNIAWSPTTPASELERTLKFAKNLGYDVVALNQTITGNIPTQPHPISNPIPQLTSPHPSFPGGSGSTSATSTTTARTTTTTTNLSTTASSAVPPTSTSSLPTVLRRVTLTVTDPSTTNYRLADYARSYDLLALRPTNDKAFSWACLSTTEPPAIISLDLTQFLGFHIHHRTAMAAVHRGTRFEICYSQTFTSGNSVDAQRARSNFIGNVLGLLRATKGRGIIVSSEAKSALGLRGPADVVNLLAVWGLGPEKGTEALGTGPRAVVVNEGVKRRGFRGVVDIVQTAPGGKVRSEEEGGKEGETKLSKKQKKLQQKQQQGQKQGQQQGQGQGQKRKNWEGGGGGTDGGGQQKKQAK